MAEFDQLASVLFDGPVAARDFKTMPGTETGHSRDVLANSLLESMQRVGLIVDGKLTNKIEPES
jgi:hypothetical protein